MKYRYGPPSKREWKCNAEIVFGDDFGDNSCTFRCGLPKGHLGSHREEGGAEGKDYILEWKN